MTPEERAREIVARWKSGGYGWAERLEAGIVSAIRAALEEETERCAREASSHVCRLTRLPCDGTAAEGDECACRVANRIAAAIRRKP